MPEQHAEKALSPLALPGASHGISPVSTFLAMCACLAVIH